MKKMLLLLVVVSFLCSISQAQNVSPECAAATSEFMAMTTCYEAAMYVTTAKTQNGDQFALACGLDTPCRQLWRSWTAACNPVS